MHALVARAPGSGAVVGVRLGSQSGVAAEALVEGNVLPVRQIIGIGRNYAAHAREQNLQTPERPLVFTKNPSSAILHEQDIVIPRVCRDADGEALPAEAYPDQEQVDYEGELAVVIGAPVRDAAPSALVGADSPILGICCANDVSARWWQKQGSAGQYVRGKSFDTFCPLGPHVVPIADVPALDAIAVETRVNGEVMQRDTTASMMFPVVQLIAELSRGTTLVPGTVILTGTPSGVGMARTPPRFLRAGDVVEVEVEGVGVLRNRVRLEA
ncbi:MAG: fumarylacetoacetate hydrolase family protein [Phycisphaerales bacterium]|nr:fumarylacetoacetate hydrolase family protein [Phycisphaerales bacterium]